jgi:branched-chain amino acid transport system ATP-binding protein
MKDGRKGGGNPETMRFFSAEDLTMRFGGLLAVDRFSLELARGELVGLIGPNGAGKTTVFNVIAGMLQPASGRIVFAGEEITGLKPNAVTRRGIARTFQNIRLFQDMKVLENVMISHHGRLRSSFLGAVLQTPLYRREEQEMAEGSLKLLRMVGLEDFARERAGGLSYGQQRRLEIVRALASQPRLLLLDEPAAGMNPQETQELMRFILKIKKEFDLTILLIEHDMQVIMGICERIMVLDYGAVIAEGTPREIQANPRVVEAYLGEEEGGEKFA